MINQPSQKGFTLIEMIVSLAVFSVVVTISIGALLTLIATNKQLQAEQSVMTNLSFALDSMTREIRTGTNYFCEDATNYSQLNTRSIFRDGTDMDSILSGADSTQDCEDGNSQGSGRPLQGIAFVETGDSITGSTNERILYFFDNLAGSPNQGKIMRKVGNGNPESIVSSGIYITEAEFFVTGSSRIVEAPSSPAGNGYVDQPTVTIFIEAYETNDVTKKPYRIQTTVTQRTLDI